MTLTTKFSLLVLSSSLLMACVRESEKVSYNLSREADSFNVYRRIVFINGITDSHLLTITGFCSILTESATSNIGKATTVVCKTENNTYVKHFLGVSDNVTYFAEQLTDISVSDRHYKVVVRPSSVIPDIRLK